MNAINSERTRLSAEKKTSVHVGYESIDGLLSNRTISFFDTLFFIVSLFLVLLYVKSTKKASRIHTQQQFIFHFECIYGHLLLLWGYGRSNCCSATFITCHF